MQFLCSKSFKTACNVDRKKSAMILLACSQLLSSVSHSQKSKLTYNNRSDSCAESDDSYQSSSFDKHGNDNDVQYSVNS